MAFPPHQLQYHHVPDPAPGAAVPRVAIGGRSIADQPAPPPPPDSGPPPAAEAEPAYDSRPLSPAGRILRERFFEGLADQSQPLDELARQMITVTLAVPGIYAAVLALLRGQSATLPAGRPLIVSFGCWLAALALSFAALFPRRYQVDTTVLRGESAAGDALSLEAFFHRAARRKYWLLVAAAVAFTAGVVVAVWLLFAAPAAPPPAPTP